MFITSEKRELIYSVSFQKLLTFLTNEKEVKIKQTKYGYFFYNKLIEENRGKFKIKGKVEYKTGYQYETFICNEDITNFEEMNDEEKYSILFDLGFREDRYKNFFDKML